MQMIANKAIVLEMYRRMIGARDVALIDTYISDQYIQHSPMLPDGKAGLRTALEQLKQFPPAAEGGSPVICAVAEGDYVALLLDISFMGKSLLVLDLFRLEQGIIVEHWDAMQAKGASAGTVRSRIKVHRILQEGMWTVIQSEGFIEDISYVFYDISRRGGVMVEEQITVAQQVPEQLPHTNGMI